MNKEQLKPYKMDPERVKEITGAYADLYVFTFGQLQEFVKNNKTEQTLSNWKYCPGCGMEIEKDTHSFGCWNCGFSIPEDLQAELELIDKLRNFIRAKQLSAEWEQWLKDYEKVYLKERIKQKFAKAGSEARTRIKNRSLADVLLASGKKSIYIPEYIKANAKTRRISKLRKEFELLIKGDNQFYGSRTSEIFITLGKKKGEKELKYYPLVYGSYYSHVTLM